MNAYKVQLKARDAPTTTDERPVPRCVLLGPYKAMRWLYVPLLSSLRERFGTKFVILLPSGSDLEEQYRPHCGPQDIFLEYPEFQQMSDFCTLGVDDTFERARQYEQYYGAHFRLDIYQQEREVALAQLPGKRELLFPRHTPPSDEELARIVNGSFEFYETVFRNHDIDVAMIWPRTGAEAVCAAVAAKRGILVTYPYTAKYKTYSYWATGAYAGPEQHYLAYEATPPCAPMPVSAFAPPPRAGHLEQSKIAWRYSLRRSVYETARTLYLYFRFWQEDLFKGSFGVTHRRSMSGTLLDIWRNHFYFKKFMRLCERETERLRDRPYVLFAFQNEPEFSIQARSKEFNDQGAVIRQLARCLPPGVNLVIKEHAWVGERKLSYYEDLLALPNVIMADPGIRAIDLIPDSCVVASFGGTVTLEAAVFGKPALVFSERSEFEILPSVTKVRTLADMSQALNCVLSPTSARTSKMYRAAAARFCKAIEYISFNAETFYTKSGNALPETELAKSIELLRDLMKFHQLRSDAKSLK